MADENVPGKVSVTVVPPPPKLDSGPPSQPFWQTWNFWRTVFAVAAPILAIVCPLLPGVGGPICGTVAVLVRSLDSATVRAVQVPVPVAPSVLVKDGGQ